MFLAALGAYLGLSYTDGTPVRAALAVLGVGVAGQVAQDLLTQWLERRRKAKSAQGDLTVAGEEPGGDASLASPPDHVGGATAVLEVVVEGND